MNPSALIKIKVLHPEQLNEIKCDFYHSDLTARAVSNKPKCVG